MGYSYTRLETALLWTLLYADVFDFPMTAHEIHHFLLETQVSFKEVEQKLHHMVEGQNPLLKCQEIQGTAYFAMLPRADVVFANRTYREEVSAVLWKKAEYYGRLLSYLPFVRMVALTGALSMRNAGSPEDDLDYMLVIRNGRVWLARLSAVILVKLSRLRGVTLCPNYVLAEDALLQEQQDSFVAHELAQMVPLSDTELYQKMREINAWADRFLPNAKDVPFYTAYQDDSKIGLFFQRLTEFILGGRLGNTLEAWEQKRKIHKFQTQIHPESAAQLDEKHVKGHFQDHGQRILREFYERLDAYHLPHPKFNFHEFSHESAAD